ncbi:ankyrin repeat domain-containing protein 29 isoform X4 [Stegostoma tigrinum]|uniref:ankyrin repeat domain-containing protein 29 isoform X4 n=1 Tax=Stegostoma tigrinum TaxID=3053191 RepID=UPI00202B11F1|nr:ankyrin repeat domain-containing protein 29 isoform X4 [Stegostoma tigrinum]
MYLDRLAGGSGSWSSHQFTVEVQSRPARTVLSASGCGRNLGPLCDVQREMPLANAVFWTARKGNVTLLRLLLNSGRMDADCKDSLGTTALMVASYCNHKDCVRELILQGADINLQREDGATPLSIASQNGHVKVVEILLNRRCNVNIQLKDGATSLFLAAQGGHLNVINMLLASGAKIDQPRQDLTTPLWIAAQMGYNDVVKLLLQWGAHSDTARKDGSTPLFKAAYKGFIEVVRELLACSPSLGILKNGTTALHAAVLGGNVKTVGLLIDSGADPNLRNTAEELPADLTRNDRLIQQLQSKQKRGES